MEREDLIQGLISVGEGTEKISVLLPKKLLDTLLSNYRKKVGAIREHGLTSSALIYFSARGVIDWEQEQHGAHSRGGGDAWMGPAVHETFVRESKAGEPPKQVPQRRPAPRRKK